ACVDVESGRHGGAFGTGLADESGGLELFEEGAVVGRATVLAEKAGHVAGDQVDLEVVFGTDGDFAEGGDLGGVGDEDDVEAVVAAAVDGEADAVDGDRALFGDVAGERGGKVEGDEGGLADGALLADADGAVHVAGDDVPAHAPAEG